MEHSAIHQNALVEFHFFNTVLTDYNMRNINSKYSCVRAAHRVHLLVFVIKI